MGYRTSYGLGFDSGPEYDQIGFYRIVPYTALDKPNDKSEYNDPILNIIGTTISYFKEGLRDEDITKSSPIVENYITGILVTRN